MVAVRPEFVLIGIEFGIVASLLVALALIPKPGRRPGCCRCGYDRSGLTLESACPECGLSEAKAGPSRPRRVFWMEAAALLAPVGLIVLAAAIRWHGDARAILYVHLIAAPFVMPLIAGVGWCLCTRWTSRRCGLVALGVQAPAFVVGAAVIWATLHPQSDDVFYPMTDIVLGLFVGIPVSGVATLLPLLREPCWSASRGQAP